MLYFGIEPRGQSELRVEVYSCYTALRAAVDQQVWFILLFSKVRVTPAQLKHVSSLQFKSTVLCVTGVLRYKARV